MMHLPNRNTPFDFKPKTKITIRLQCLLKHYQPVEKKKKHEYELTYKILSNFFFNSFFILHFLYFVVVK